MKDKKIVAYIVAGHPPILDADKFTHVNYAFGIVTADDKLIIRNPEELQALAHLRDQYGFKLLVSLQQRPRGTFCARTKTAEGCALLAKQCKQLVDTYRLDGIDVDWEYPGIDITTGECNCDTCRDDFINLLAAIRKEIGEDKLLTIACAATQDTWVATDFVRAAEILDFINVMGYDYNWNKFGMAHHSNLYPATVGIGDHAQCGDRAIRLLTEMGIPAKNLVLGLPLYGYQKDKGTEGFLRYGQITERIASGEFVLCYDEGAKQSYVTKNGEMAVAFDDPQTIAWKAEYVKEKGLGGLMYWAYALDDDNGTLRKAVYDALLAN